MEENLVINGGNKLFGQLKVDASKNAFLPILAGCILCDGQINIKNYVNLSDIRCMRAILELLDCNTFLNGNELVVDTTNASFSKIGHELTSQLRASIFLLGPMLSRFKKAVIAYPGGCRIGARPIDIHLKGLRALGARILERHGYLYCNGENMKSGTFVLDFASVGATESLMMASVFLAGTTTLKNVAKEPEIEDLQNFLNTMGAKIRGAGTDTIVIEGVKTLFGGEYTIMPDRIVAGTYLLATASCGGEIELIGTNPVHNESLLDFLSQTACKIRTSSDKICLKVDQRLSSIKKIQTMPYPNFPTDLQPQMMVLQSISEGSCLLTENLFENRFGIVSELDKMGADITIKGHTALIRGVEKLYGADVFATDLRAGAGLVLAGLVAEGYTTISNIPFIDRGYERIEEKFKLLGADIKRV